MFLRAVRRYLLLIIHSSGAALNAKAYYIDF